MAQIENLYGRGIHSTREMVRSFTTLIVIEQLLEKTRG
jgi:hypothetical protein